MACLSLAFWEAVAIWVVVLIAIVALLRLLIVALGGGGGAIWPPVTWPPVGPTAAGPLGFVAAALNIIIWAIIMIAIIWFIFALIGCLLGAAGGLRFPRVSAVEILPLFT
jgi:hypothetical protein